MQIENIRWYIWQVSFGNWFQLRSDDPTAADSEEEIESIDDGIVTRKDPSYTWIEISFRFM